MRRGWVVAVAACAVVMVAAVGVWLWLGNNPSVSAGSFGGPGPGVKIGTYPVTSEPRWVMQGDRAVIVESVRNTGNVPFTLTGVIVEPGSALELAAQFQPDVFTDGGGLGGTDQRAVPTVTVDPDHEVGLVLTVTALPCSQRSNGPQQLGEVQVLTRTLGITTAQWVTFMDSRLLIPGLDANRKCVEPQA